MSTTRWIIETPCEMCGGSGFEPCYEPQPCAGEPCRSCHQMGVTRLVVDPDNLPPEAIQRAAKMVAELTGCDEPLRGADFCPACGADAEAIVRAALLSDPEQGDQT